MKLFSFNEYKLYSMFGQDGLIDSVFKKIGVTNKFYVEFGVENGLQCNTRALKEKGWTGLWMDGVCSIPPVKQEYITQENINGLFKKYSVPFSFDILSIDIDMNTYWVWKALSSEYRPRLIVVEYNASYPPPLSVSTAYEPNRAWDGTTYFGASLSALEKLGEKKGYALVGTDSNGCDAFFIAEELCDSSNKLTAKELYHPPAYGAFDGGHRPTTERMIKV